MLNDKNTYVYVVNENTHIGRFNSIYDVIDHIRLKFEDVTSIGITTSSKICMFLDDERIISDVTWVKYPKYWQVHSIRTYENFKSRVINVLNCTYHRQEAISIFDFSFDHDLQCFDENGDEKTGYDCVKWLCSYCMEHNIDLDKLSYVVHSKNPVGAQNITSYIENCRKFQNDNQGL